MVLTAERWVVAVALGNLVCRFVFVEAEAAREAREARRKSVGAIAK
jgi:hypothetical protein